MGEYAEMMLDGTCCEGCGEYMGGGSPGFPRYCSAACARGRGVETRPERRATTRPPEGRCDKCGKRCKSAAGLIAHMRDKHHILPRHTLGAADATSAEDQI